MLEKIESQVSVLEEELSEVRVELNKLKDDIKLNAQFEKEMQYQVMLDRLKKRWNNI